MLSGAVSNRYAKGLFAVAAEHGDIDASDASLRYLSELLSAYPEFQTLLTHPLIDPPNKIAVVRHVLADALTPQAERFLTLLFSRHRGNYIVPIARRFHELAQEAKGEADIQIDAARPLAQAQVAEMEIGLGNALQKKVRAAVKLNADLIAGVLVRIGDRVVDATLRGALTQASQQLARHAGKEGTR